MLKAILTILITCSVSLAQDVQNGQTIEIDLNAPTKVALAIAADASAAADALAAQAMPPGEIAFTSAQANRAMPTVDLNVSGGEPLLAALAKLGAAAKARPSTSWPRNAAITLTIEKSDEGRTLFSAPVSHHGAFAVFLTEINSTHHLPITGNAGDSRGRPVSFQFQLMGEPKVAIVATHYQMDLEEASDAEGKNYVAPERHRHESWNSHLHPPLYQFNSSVNNVPREVTKFALLKGNIRVRAVKKFVTWNITPSDQKQELLVGDVTCEVQPIKPQGNPQQARRAGGNQSILIRVPKGDLDGKPWQDRQELFRASRLLAYDDAGKRLSEGWRGYGGGGDSITLTFNLSQQPREIGPLDKAVWYAPLEYEEIAVPFEFKDVPLTY